MMENLKELYISQTGNKEPDNQIFWSEWYGSYVKWLETELSKKL